MDCDTFDIPGKVNIPSTFSDPVIWALPVILVVPINVWTSEVSSPKVFEPDVTIVEPDIKVFTTKWSIEADWAVRVDTDTEVAFEKLTLDPDTSNEPVISADPENGNPVPEPPPKVSSANVLPTYLYPVKVTASVARGASLLFLNCKTPVL